MQTITFITSNVNKVKQLSRYLEVPFDHQALELDEIQSMSVEEVATKKAESAYQELGRPVLVEDTSLVLTAMNGLPGPLIKWFLESIGNEGLCQLLDQHTSRAATAQTCFALCDENGVHLFLGETTGLIASEPRGDTAFGWDPIFIATGETKTWSELADIDFELTRATSMRRKAITKLQSYLEENYK